MKKLLLLSAVSLVACGLATGQASAGIFDLFGGHGDDDHYRPYNAFDPYSEPSGHGHHGCHGHCCHGQPYVPPPIFVPVPMFMPPAPCCNDMGGCSCINSGCCDAGCLPAPNGDGGPPAPVAPDMPAPSGPKFTPPAPTPLQDTSEISSESVLSQPNMMSAAGNNPGYYPVYAGNYPGSYAGYYPANAGYYGGYNPGYGNYPAGPAGMYGAMRPFSMPYAPSAMPGYGAYGMPGYGYYGR